VEALHQEYRDRVNFLYMYVREAHPNPATAPCGSTADLGWDHPSRDTVTIEERAQRARWLKNDFDLSFPYIIDTMDAAIQGDYRPHAFYVGWVIDCDGRADVSERWGWATPETQWCGLPLPNVNELRSFLDAYLANPSPCYRGPSEATAFVVPAVARIDGVGDTAWVSDVTLANPHATPVEIELTYLARDRDNIQAPTFDLVVGPGQSMNLEDVVQGTFGTSGSGALLVQAQRPVVVVSRTFNDTPEGTFGQFIAGFDERDAIHEGQIGHLLMLEESGLFRTNFGLVNLGLDQVTVEVLFVDPSGSDLGTLSRTLPPRGVTQINRVLRELTELEISGFRAEVRVVTPEGRVMAYGSVVDNSSGDPTFIDTRLNTHAIDIVVPAAARLAGANGTQWASDLLLHNARPHQVQATVRRWNRDADNSGAETIELNLSGGESLLLDDIVDALFSDTGAAALAINATDGLMATSRTFNDAASGTFGQLVPGMDSSEDTTLRPGRLGHLAQLEQTDLATGRRTNLGLVNLGEDPVEVEVRFFAGDGSALGELNPQLPPFGYIQINEALAEAGAADAANVRAEIEVITVGGRVLAYASTVDNRTGDPVFQMAWTRD
jgi:hypothetical protein